MVDSRGTREEAQRCYLSNMFSSRIQDGDLTTSTRAWPEPLGHDCFMLSKMLSMFHEYWKMIPGYLFYCLYYLILYIIMIIIRIYIIKNTLLYNIYIYNF